MPWGLKRYYETGGLHFISWSCHDRQPLLGHSERRDLLLKVIEQMRNRYRFGLVGFVVMPEHVHLPRRQHKRVPHLWPTLPEVGFCF
jgi:putative transposase